MPVKKTPKKATKKRAKKAITKPKKAAVKKAPKTKKELVFATNDTSFWVKNGQILNSLVALNDALAEMEKEVFAHHVSKDKNDFSLWVAEVLCDEDCAKALAKAKTPQGAQTVVTRHLKQYSL